MAKVVADDGVVHGLRRSAAVRVRRDYDPARDTGGARGDVAREVVARKLHATCRAKKRDADSRDIPVVFRRSTRASIVLDRVTSHLEANYVFIKLVSFEEHASAVVADRVSGDGASFSYVADVDAPPPARDVVANDLGVVVGPFRPEDDDARITGAAYVVGEDLGAGRFDDNRAGDGAVRDVVGDDLRTGRVSDGHAEPVAYEVVLLAGGVGGPVLYLDRDLAFGFAFGVALDNILHDFGIEGAVCNKDARSVAFGVAYDIIVQDGDVDAPANDDPAGDIAYCTVILNGGVASAGKVDREYRFAPPP